MKRIFSILSVCLVFASCHHEPVPLKQADVIYIETNNFHTNQNAVLAYWHYDDGTVAPVPGSPFYTNGSGIANPTQALGPEDNETQIKVSADGRFL